MVLESPRDLIALAPAVARTVARATAQLGNAARTKAAGFAHYDALGGGELSGDRDRAGPGGPGPGPGRG